MADGRLPLYEEVAARLLFDPVAERAQREGTVGHPHIDADWVQSADMQLGEDPDAWTGVTRNDRDLPVTPGPREDRSWQGL